MKIPKWYSDFDSKSRSWMDKVDLKKKFPRGYVNKWVFRGTLIFAVIFFLFALFSSGTGSLRGEPYLFCDESRGEDCINPFYWCLHDPVDASLNRVQCPDDIKDTCQRFSYLCADRLIPSGGHVGKEPSELLKNAELIGILIICSAFPINHILYKVRRSEDEN